MNSELPMQTDPEMLSLLAQPVLGEAAALLGLRVFLAEDEPILLWALEEIMSDLGCTVAGMAARVTDATAFVASHPVDVAVLDGTLSDGPIDPAVAVLAARGTPVIIASGVASMECSARFGNVIYLQKPYQDADLRQALLLAMAQGQSERKLVV